MNRCIMITAVIGVKIMIDRSKYNIMTDQYIISDEYAALILKMAGSIDEDSLSYVDISSKIRMKRR